MKKFNFREGRVYRQDRIIFEISNLKFPTGKMSWHIYILEIFDPPYALMILSAST